MKPSNKSDYGIETLLIVDDNPDNLVVMKKVIQKDLPDLSIFTCQQAEKAPELLLENDIGVALIDVQMPGIDGIELCKQIKSNADTHHAAVILITSHSSDPKMKARGLEVGADDFVMRPIDNTELAARVKVALRIHRAESGLRNVAEEAQDQYKLLFDKMVSGFTVLDVVRDNDGKPANFRFVSVNPAFEKLTTLCAKDVIGRTITEAIPGVESRWIERYCEVAETGKPACFEDYTAPLNKHFSIDAFLVNKNQLAVSFSDITDRKLAEDALNVSRVRFRSIAESMSDGIWEVDTNGVYTYVSPGMVSILGYEKEEVLGKTPFDFMPPDEAERVGDIFKETLGSRKSFRNLENWNLTKDGKRVCLWTSGVPIFNEDGELLGYRGVDTDITERKLAEESKRTLEAQLRQSQKLESLGTLSSGVAHEINNPVNGIMNYAQLILDELGPDHEVAEFATEIGKETERVSTIVRNLLAFARQEKQTHSPARMCDIVESTLSLIRTVMRHDQITLELEVSEDLPKFKCRSQQIQQIIMNLLTNARDALNEKYEDFDKNKKVIITACALDRNDHQWIRLTVEDHGVGVAEDVRERMFDPFYTTKPRDEGTGLGMSISHGIVKDHGGEITVESEVGEWTRIHVDLPVDNGWGLEDAEDETQK